MTLRQPPVGFKGHPAWEAFELWMDARPGETDQNEWQLFWDCFYAGFEIGLIEGGEA